jgi:glutamine cyclotransferase
MLYESTGLINSSSLRRIDPATGRVLTAVQIRSHFAEGIAIIDDVIYQLTWTSGLVFRYDLASMNQIDTLRLGHEGWGLAADKSSLLISDGSSCVRRYDTPDFSQPARLKVRAHGMPLRHLNDLEVAGGRLYANIWCSSLIAEIDLKTSNVSRLLDCSELVRFEKPRTKYHILNGIAFNEDANSFFVTGKCWRKLFEVTLD